MLYRSPSANVQENGKRSGAFALSQSVRQIVYCNLYFTLLVLEHLLCRLKKRTCSPALREINLPDGARARVSVYAEGVSSFVLQRH